MDIKFPKYKITRNINGENIDINLENFEMWNIYNTMQDYAEKEYILNLVGDIGYAGGISEEQMTKVTTIAKKYLNDECCAAKEGAYIKALNEVLLES